MSHRVLSLFPVPVYVSSIGDVPKDTLEIIEKLNYIPKENGLAGISSEENLEHLLDKLTVLAVKHCKKYFYEILNFKKDFQFKISDCWIAFFDEGSTGASNHTHDNSLYTCVVYLNVDGKGNITFTKSVNLGDFSINLTPPIDENNLNEYNSNSFEFSPKNGDIIIFPSNLLHKIDSNKCNERRYSFIFNIIPSGIVCNQVSRRLII